jgi:hypothetical protein
LGVRSELPSGAGRVTTFYCSVARVATMADGGLRVYLDLPEDAIIPAAEMMAYKRHATVVDVEMTPRTESVGDSTADDLDAVYGTSDE